MVVGQGLGSHRSHSLILLLMMINLTEIDGMVVGHVLGSHRFNNKNNLC